MGKIGTKQKPRTRQSLDGELGLIIDEFGRAMWSANRDYIAHTQNSCFPSFTLNMADAWSKYIMFCRENPQ